jgi:hypothetical protein
MTLSKGHFVVPCRDAEARCNDITLPWHALLISSSGNDGDAEF